MTRCEKFAALDRWLSRLYAERPLAFNLLALAASVVAGAVLAVVLYLIDGRW